MNDTFRILGFIEDHATDTQVESLLASIHEAMEEWFLQNLYQSNSAELIGIDYENAEWLRVASDLASRATITV